MADLNESSTWEDGIYQIETTDPVVGGPDGISNVQAKQLANRTYYLKDRIDATDQQLASIEAQTAVVTLQGEATIANRGIIKGAEVTASDTATRNLNVAAGRLFLGGRPVAVYGEENTASVPDNGTDTDAVVYVYARIYNGDLVLASTALDEDPPADALALDRIDVPAYNDELSDPYLDNVTITRVAREEPYWPFVHSAPAYVDVTLPEELANAGYAVVLDGTPDEADLWPDDRATNSFRIYLAGAADGVTVRWTATLAN